MASGSTRKIRAQFLTLPKAARLLGISRETLRRAIASGELPVYRVRNRWLRVDSTEAVEWMRSYQVTIPSPADRPVDRQYDRERAQ